MLDRSTKLDASLMDAYNSIHELHKGHAAGDSDLDKQASQLASDIRYKAKSKFKEGTNPEDKKRIYLSLLSSSSAPTVVKQKAKKKLLGESVTEDAAYDSVLKKLKGEFGSNAVLGTGEKIKDTRSEKSKKKATRKRAASDEKERRFKKRNPAVTSGRYPKDDEKAWASAREREKREGIGEATAVGKIINAIREDSKYGYDSKGRSKNPADIKKRKKVSEGKLIHGPFGPYITGQKMPKEQKETPLKQVPYEGLNGSRKSVGEEKVEEEVGVSSSAAMKAAQAEAKLRKKEQDAVKKEKKALKREEASPAVEKVIESIKINKCTPKSPNVVIMPKKDDITDKAGGKTTKDVVSKKHKQFFNKEDKVKTFRQFVTETEQVDESLLGGIAKVGSAVKKSQAVAKGAKAVKAVSDTASGAADLAKGGAQMASQVAQKRVTHAGKVVQGAGRLGGDVVKHGGSALKTGAETIKKTGSISTGVEKFGTEFSKNRIIAQGRAPVKAVTGGTKTKSTIVDTDKLNRMAKSKWRGTKRKIGNVAKGTAKTAEVAANIKIITQKADGNEHDVPSGSRTGELRNPT